jgi:hypothetical protein
MGHLPRQLVRDLRDRLGLVRAIETGTYRGQGARQLAEIFPRVTTIEIDPTLARVSARSLEQLAGVEVREGSSRDVLPTLIDRSQPTLYWLDGHWSGGATGGADDECPVLAEIAATAAGNPNDCVLVDDARLFLAPPPAPHRAEHWPTFRVVEDALAAAKPGNLTAVAHDVVVSVPSVAADLVAEFAAAETGPIERLRGFVTGLVARTR